MRVIGRKLLVYPAQVEHGVDLSNQMIWRNHLVQIKRIKELTLPDFPPTHHEPPPRIIAHRRNHGSSIVSTRVLHTNRRHSGRAAIASFWSEERCQKTFGAGYYRAGWYLLDDDTIELDEPSGWQSLVSCLF